MRRCISIILSAVLKLWRTLCSTFVKKHLYKKDVDADGYEEVIIDLNGQSSSICQDKEDNVNDR